MEALVTRASKRAWSAYLGEVSELARAAPPSEARDIVLEVIKVCFPQLLQSHEGAARMKEMIPTYDVDIKLAENAEYFRTVSRTASERLQLGAG